MKPRIWHGNRLASSTIRTFIVVTVLAVCAACTNRDRPVAQEALRVQLPYEPATLDFSLFEDGMSLRVLPALMSGLVRYDRDYKVKLDLAERMEKLDGGKRLRFKLKPWTWSDGKPVSAADFVFAFERTLRTSTPAKGAELLYFIRGARDYKRGVVTDFTKVGVRALAADLLEFELEKPTSFFPHILTLPVAYPQRKDQVEELGPQWSRHMHSTGPYRLVRWQHDQRFELERNPHYPAFTAGAPEKISFQIIAEDTTAVTLFESRKLDVLFKAPTYDLDRLRGQGLIHEFPYFAVYYLGFDQRQAPWSDVSARRAVALAINKKEIAEAVAGSELAATSWIPRGLPGHNPEVGIRFERAKAKKVWDESAGRGARRLVLGFDTGSRNQTVAERVQAELQAHLDARVELRPRDWKTYLGELAAKPPGMFRFGWLSPYVDAYPNLAVFTSASSNNYTGWKNRRYDALVNRIGALEPGTTERTRLIDEAQRLLLEGEVVVVPIYHYVQTVAVSPRIEGFWANGMGMVDYLAVRLRSGR